MPSASAQLQPVFGYVRISEDPLQLRAGVQRQRADVMRTVAQKGWDDHPILWFEDNDLSAYQRNVRRPAFEQVLDDLHEAFALVAYNLDRLLRQPRELERVLDRAHEVKLTRLVTVEGDIDLSTHDGQLHARILVAVAKKASDDTSRRVKRAAQDRAERGLWSGQQPPFGYVRDGSTIVPNPAEAALLTDAIQRLLAGEPMNAVASRINLTPAGLRRLLRSPTITGRTSVWAPAEWPAIVPADVAADVRALLDSRRRGPQVASTHWLSSVLTCVACDPGGHRGMPWAGGSSVGGGYKHLACGNTILADKTEDLVARWLVDAVEKFIDTTADVQVVGPTGNHDDRQAEERLAELAHDYASGLISRAEWLAARAVLQPQPTLAARPRQDVPRDLAQVWPDLPAPQRRSYALQLLHRVEVSAATGPRGVWDPGRLHPVWRQ